MNGGLGTEHNKIRKITLRKVFSKDLYVNLRMDHVLHITEFTLNHFLIL